MTNSFPVLTIAYGVLCVSAGFSIAHYANKKNDRQESEQE